MKRFKYGFKYVFVGVLAWQGVCFASQQKQDTFTTRAIATKIVVEAISSEKHSKLATALVNKLKTEADKDQFRILITELRAAKGKPYTFTNFADQIRLVDAKGHVLLVTQLGEKANTVLVNGVVSVSFDPSNIWKSVTNSKKKKYSLISTFISEANAEADRKQTDIVTAAILMTAFSSRYVEETPDTRIRDDYFAEWDWKSSIPFIEAKATSRAVCVENDKARSSMKEWPNTKIEDMGEYYKVSSADKKNYFKIKLSKIEMPGEDLSKCYLIANAQLPAREAIKLFRDRYVENSDLTSSGLETYGDAVKLGRYSNVLTGDAEKKYNLLFNLESLPEPDRDQLRDYAGVRMDDKQQEEYYKKTEEYHKQKEEYDKQKEEFCPKRDAVEVEKCDSSSCAPSDFLSLGKEFNPLLFDYEAVRKKNSSAIDELIKVRSEKEKIIRDPNRYSGKEISVARKKIEEVNGQIEQILGSKIEKEPHRSDNYLFTEILNLNVFGKCCANSKCKGDVFDNRGLPMNYEQPSKKGAR